MVKRLNTVHVCSEVDFYTTLYSLAFCLENYFSFLKEMDPKHEMGTTISFSRDSTSRHGPVQNGNLDILFSF